MNVVRNIPLLELIKERLDDETIYRYYIPNFQLNVAISNPFRKDRNPSFSLFYKDYKLRHIDFADTTFSGDYIDLVKQIYGLRDQADALEKIAQDFGLRDKNKVWQKVEREVPKSTVVPSVIRCSVRSRFRKIDREYWKQFGISEGDCRREKIYSVVEYCINDYLYTLDNNELCYGYLFPDGKWKIYKPYAKTKKGKWKFNGCNSFIESRELIQESDKIIITKSRKDKICLGNILQEYRVINVQNESLIPYTEELIKELKGKKVFINYDSDKSGKEASIVITTKYPQFKHLNIPDKYLDEGLTDFSDLYRVHGEQVVLEYLNKKGIR